MPLHNDINPNPTPPPHSLPPPQPLPAQHPLCPCPPRAQRQCLALGYGLAPPHSHGCPPCICLALGYGLAPPRGSGASLGAQSPTVCPHGALGGGSSQDPGLALGRLQMPVLGPRGARALHRARRTAATRMEARRGPVTACTNVGCVSDACRMCARVMSDACRIWLALGSGCKACPPPRPLPRPLCQTSPGCSHTSNTSASRIYAPPGRVPG